MRKRRRRREVDGEEGREGGRRGEGVIPLFLFLLLHNFPAVNLDRRPARASEPRGDPRPCGYAGGAPGGGASRVAASSRTCPSSARISAPNNT